MTRAQVRRLALLLLAGLYALMWVGGVAAYVSRGGPAAHEAWTAPVFLALAGLLVLLASRASEAAWLCAALVLGFASEYAGVRCGCIFGEYGYTDVLLVTVGGVPAVIAVAWMILIAYVMQMLLLLKLPVWLQVPAGATWMTAIDLVVDPVAAGPLRYWTWIDTGAYYGIPFHNFAGWFVVSAVIVGVLLLAHRWSPNAWTRRIGVSIVLFFGVIAVAHGLVVCAAIAGVLAVVHAVVSRGDLRAASARLASA